MSSEVEFAFVGRDIREFLPRGPETYMRPFFDANENMLAWEERQRVTLAVEDDEKLERILGRAIEAGGVQEADWTKHRGKLNYGTYRYIALRDDDSPIPLIERLVERVVLVDGDGHATWGNGLYGDLTYGQLLAAADAGAMPGDATQIYVNPRLSPAGGEFYVEWDLVLDIWRVAYEVAQLLAAAGGAYYVIEKVAGRLAGYRVAERKSRDWLKRNGYPDLLQEMLRGEPWSPRELAALLGCTVDEADQMLALHGYEKESGERWVYVAGDERLGLRAEDLSARIVKAYSSEARFKHASATKGPSTELEALFRKIVEEAIETGKVSGLRYEAYFGRDDETE